MDDGSDHRGATGRCSSATQSRYTVNNSSRQTRHRLADDVVLRSGRVSILDGRLGAVQRLADVRQTEAVVVQVVVDSCRRRFDANSAVLPAHRLYSRHHDRSFTVSPFQNQRESACLDTCGFYPAFT